MPLMNCARRLRPCRATRICCWPEASRETTAIWWLADGRRTCEEIVERIAALFGRQLDEVEDDVGRTLSDLAAVNVIEYP